MKLWNFIVHENINRYSYFMSEKERQGYMKKKLCYACAPLLVLLMMLIRKDYSSIAMIPFAMMFFYKFPYILLSMRHTQNCNDVVSAIPLWVNQIYALIEKNTIHNAIVNSLSEHTPKAIQHDLKEFIERIEKQPDDKQAYLDFLSRYQIEGFLDIMLKLYEFRSLSKEKLKYEIRNLNQSLSKIEALKRQNQFKNEVFVGDTCTCFIIFIPCLYMTIISLMPSLFTV